MAVLWCTAIMMVTVLGLAAYVSSQLDENITRGRAAKARTLALSGLAIGLHPQVKRNDPLLAQAEAKDRRFQVTLSSEDGRINLNQLLMVNRTDILERLWIAWGLSPDAARALDDCLQDWIEPGSLKRLNGAKQAQYAALGHPEYPPGRPFQTLDEVSQVLGFAQVERVKPDWRNFFTLWSDGKLDLDEAPAELIAPFCNIGLSTARSYVQNRDPNGRPGSPDGWHPGSVEEATSYLGMTPIELKRTEPLLVVDGTVWRVESVGTAYGCRHTVVAVAARDGTTRGYYLWQEF
jgi:general secretion pathway protein K